MAELALSMDREVILASEATKPENCSPRSEHVGRWENILYSQSMFCTIIGISHVFGIIGLVLIFQGRVLLSTIIFAQILSDLSILGVTLGAHRLWAHRCYKARTPLKVILATCFAFAGQHSLWQWTANHRIHHKYADTDMDPHNSNRGFFYSHVGWLLTYNHQVFLTNVKRVDTSDLERDSIVMFHHKYTGEITLTCLLLIPVLIPWWILGESVYNSFCVAACLRHMWVLHRTFIANSIAHFWGYKPYDSSIRPVENKMVSVFTFGEGWHNYHHVFPWDYKAAEFGIYRWNVSTALIDFFAWIGRAYDLKSVANKTIMLRSHRTGGQHLQDPRQILDETVDPSAISL